MRDDSKEDQETAWMNARQSHYLRHCLPNPAPTGNNYYY